MVDIAPKATAVVTKLVRRSISLPIVNEILRRQEYKCANKPGSTNEIKGYPCLLWSSPTHTGTFDASGHEVDHIHPFALSGNRPGNMDPDDIGNLQALCAGCHRKKTHDERPKQVIYRRKQKRPLAQHDNISQIVSTRIA